MANNPNLHMNTSAVETATLYLVASPIGNLTDISLRAIDVLRQADWIACEDTRRARILLHAHEIETPLELYHDRNQERKTPKLIRKLRDGETAALITDAGSPGIADPGFTLVRAAIAEDINVVPIPGASAVIAAVTASGLPCDRFVFEGYLPQTPKKRNRRFAVLKDETRTMVLFIPPRRLERDFKDLVENFAARRACLAREITKVHEEFLRGTVSELHEYVQNHSIRGELTLVVAGDESM